MSIFSFNTGSSISGRFNKETVFAVSSITFPISKDRAAPVERIVASVTSLIALPFLLKAPSTIESSLPKFSIISRITFIWALYDGPAISTYPAEIALNIMISPIGVEKSVVYKISFVTSQFLKQSLAVAIIVPWLTYILGLCVLVTTSVSSPSLPIEVKPIVFCNPISSINLFKTVVLPTFFSIPIIDNLL